MTVARVANAAKEAGSLLTKGGTAAAEIIQSDARGNLSLGAALDLSAVQTKLGAVMNVLNVNEPDVLAPFTREVNREYFKRRAAELPHAVAQRSVADLEDVREAIEAREAAERRAIAAEEAAARETAARVEAERREAEALAAATVREAEWQRATAEHTAAQLAQAESPPPGCRVRSQARTRTVPQPAPVHKSTAADQGCYVIPCAQVLRKLVPLAVVESAMPGLALRSDEQGSNIQAGQADGKRKQVSLTP